MGKASRIKATRGPTVIREVLVRETHEPEVPTSWPEGHVSVSLTDPKDDECVLVVIHGVKHYLHATTARELEKMLNTKLDDWSATVRNLVLLGV